MVSGMMENLFDGAQELSQQHAMNDNGRNTGDNAAVQGQQYNLHAEAKQPMVGRTNMTSARQCLAWEFVRSKRLCQDLCPYVQCMRPLKIKNCRSKHASANHHLKQLNNTAVNFLKFGLKNQVENFIGVCFIIDRHEKNCQKHIQFWRA